MKIEDLTKKELVALLKLLCSRNKGEFRFYHPVNEFLRKRWSDKSSALIKELGEVDIMRDFSKFEAINRELDKLHDEKNIESFCMLDELKK